MTGRRLERRLATVLFLDIVDSTRIAGEVGDRRWRDLLREFRRIVRRQLRAHGGHEEDTAGDGFFATFSRPANAVHAATKIVLGVQGIGLDVRCGIHTGELERIDGRLGGIGAHIGARVMAQAGPAEVLVTATVRDLVVGGGIAFEPAQQTELKGIAGTWALHRVIGVEGQVLPGAVDAAQATARRVAGALPDRRRVVPDPRVLGLALIGALAIVALGAVILTLPRDRPSIAANPSGSPPTDATADGPPTMVRIDPGTNTIDRQVHDKYLPIEVDGRTLIVDGTLWQETPINLVRRNLDTGEAVAVIDKPPPTFGTWVAFGSVWFEVESSERLQRSALNRIDPISGRTLAVIELEPPLRGVAFGRDAIYALTRDAEVIEVDPDANAIIDTDPLPLETIPDAIVSVGGSVWVCECDEGRITHWDPRADAVLRTVEFAQRGFVLEDRRELSQGQSVQGNVSGDAETVWLMDGDAGTITPVNAETGEAGQPIGIPQGSYWHDFGAGSIWISAFTEVYRLRLDTLQGETIDLPDDVFAGGIAVDEATGAVWLSNFVPAD